MSCVAQWQVSLIASARGSGHVPCVCCVCSSAVAKPWLLLAQQYMGLTLRLNSVRDWLCLHGMSCCMGADPMEWDSPQQACVPIEMEFGSSTNGDRQVVLCCDLTLASSCVGSGAPQERLLWRPKSATAFFCSGLLGRSYKAILEWLLDGSRGDYTSSQGQLPSILSLCWFSKRTSVPQVLRLSAGCLWVSAAERAFGWYRD